VRDNHVSFAEAAPGERQDLAGQSLWALRAERLQVTASATFRPSRSASWEDLTFVPRRPAVVADPLLTYTGRIECSKAVIGCRGPAGLPLNLHDRAP
jgi:hypothetical protein